MSDVCSSDLDVRARLDTAARIVDWLSQENAAADTPFLRLEKQPFRVQSTLEPLDAGALDLLHAYELLDSRSALLEKLARLATPARVQIGKASFRDRVCPVW